MPRLGPHYAEMEPKLRRLPTRRPLTEADIVTPRFRLEEDGRLEIFYAPMDWVRPQARLVLVGITPGRGTMLIAYQTAVAGLTAGRSAASVLNEIKSQASFSGFRGQLVQWLEYLDIHHCLGLGSAYELWTETGERYLHPTSAIRYPVLIGGENYNGTSPRMTRHPVLDRYLREVLAPELAEIPDALVVPLGVRVDEAIARLIDEGRIESARCLVGFPHPSGRNSHKTTQWSANKAKLKRKAAAWFRQHPLQPPAITLGAR